MSASTERILFLLKTRGAQGAQALADALGLTAMAVRQHLGALAADGLVAHQDARQGVGRPRRTWTLTERGHARFPDNHSALTLDLIEAARAAFGEAGLERLIQERERRAEDGYRAAMAGDPDLAARVASLAALREREGYMARLEPLADGAVLLVEDHCPICAAAQACQALCRSELALFRAVLGPGASVTRVDHVLAGARRCAYRIAGVAGATSAE
ncbi:helix-turn-helix transcriptional regulator [Zavarzinia sp. CC-PAN008]|uniref:helix-turn-helix transcriptional regulator n=1 Tax=Zavarzinia sp. CC-PAN008 TaxID=3243332 RepID=UPI003F746D91